MTLGDRLRKARKLKRLTQKDVAKVLDIDFTTVSKWETNRAQPTLNTLLTLSEMYNASPSELLGEEYASSELDRNFMELYRKASPATKLLIMQYLRGDIQEPLSDVTKNLVKDVKAMSIEELSERYPLTIGDKPATLEEWADAIRYIKVQRIMKTME